MNAHPASLDYLIPTALTITSDLPIEVVGVDYPPSKELAFGFADEKLAVYDDDIIIRARLRLDKQANPGASGTLHLAVRYQACNDSNCLLPVTEERELALVIAKDGETPTPLHPDIFKQTSD